jgi:plasmid stabilization system protein ParE
VIRVRPQVFEAVEAIVSHYTQLSGVKLAMEFTEDFLRSVNLTVDFPLMYRAYENGLRRVNLRRFPYNILFFVTDAEVWIQVVRHQARHPSFGTGRK